MKKIVSSLCAFALVVGLAAACTDSSRDRLSEKQGDSSTTPSTAQPAAPADTGGTSAANPGSSNRTN